jgi:ribosomal protein S12 methylthiotransferase
LLEAERLAAAGVREINLLAQDLCSYGRDLPDGTRLETLLPLLADIGALSWIRLLYLSPDTLDNSLIETVASTSKVLPYFDLPLQHISDPVLQAMGRRRSSAQLRALLASIRQRLPGAVLRTTLLVGHPGEGEQEFTELLEFVQEAGFDHLGCFAYQAEAGTRSARLTPPPAKLRQTRRRRIMAAQKKISRAKLKALVGRELPLLVLGPHPESELLGLGRLARQAPEVDGEVIITEGQARPGSIVICRVKKAHAYDLEAELP